MTPAPSKDYFGHRKSQAWLEACGNGQFVQISLSQSHSKFFGGNLLMVPKNIINVVSGVFT